MKNRFIVMRDANAQFRSNPLSPGPFAMGAETLGGVPPAPTFETTDMSAAELRDAARDPSVLAMARAMPTRLVEPFDGEEDAPPTWGVEAVGADTSAFTGAGVKVAIFDTGIDTDHPAFAGVTLDTQDFSGDGIEDVNGHGTHCAGTIFGRDVDGTRIGVARGVTDVMVGKVLGNDGSGSSDMLFDALRWAADEDARVISMSLGFDFPGFVEILEGQGLPVKLAASIALEGYRTNLRMFDALMDMFRAQAAFGGGTVVVAAAGNESERQINPNFEVSASVPAAAFGVVSVGALGQGSGGLTVADFSNTNPVISAPGVNIVSAKAGDGLRSLRGTSMACPHVAGCAALWWEAQAAGSLPLTSEAIRARLRATATLAPLDPATDPLDRGHGLVQAPSGADA